MLSNNILLDTHILIWLMNGDNKLSQSIQHHIENARRDGSVNISAISIWEIAMLEQKKRIILNKPCLEWIKDSLYHGIHLLPLTPEISVESCRLPGYLAGDPADRMIVATARVESLLLITCDERILAYGKQKLVRTLDGSSL